MTGIMIALRLSKTVIAAGLAIFCWLVAIGNITDYESNWRFVQHVLAMDTVFPDSTLKWRAITDRNAQTAAYWTIIVAEALAGLAFSVAAWRMARNLRSNKASFAAAKSAMAIGVMIAFSLWFIGFLVIGGEWFAMWQSPTWNGQRAAFMFCMIVLASGLYVSIDND
jgi:predicted small integral membrane protein